MGAILPCPQGVNSGQLFVAWIWLFILVLQYWGNKALLFEAWLSMDIEIYVAQRLVLTCKWSCELSLF